MRHGSILVLALACGVPAPAAYISFDRTFADGYVDELWAGEGDTVQVLGKSPKQCWHSDSYGDVCIQVQGRHSVDLETGAWRLIEDAPAPASCPKLEGDPKAEFRLVDAAGKVRYRGKGHAGFELSLFDPGCRRYLYVNRDTELAEVDLSAFKEREIAPVAQLERSGRILLGWGIDSKGKKEKFVYDYVSGQRCEGYEYSSTPWLCRADPSLREPALDQWYRPLPSAARFVGQYSKPEFSLVDASGTVRLRDRIYQEKKDAEVYHAFSSDGRWFAYVDASGELKVVDLNDYASRTIEKGLKSSYIRFSVGGRFLSSNRVYEASTGRVVEAPKGVVLQIGKGSPDDRWFLAPTERSGALLDLAGGTTTAALTNTSWSIEGAFSPRGRFVYVSRPDGLDGVSIHETATGRRLAFAPGNWDRLSFSPDERYLAVQNKSLAERPLELWDLRHKAGQRVALTPQHYYFGMTFTGSGRWLAYSSGSELLAWRVRPGVLQRGVIAKLLEADASLRPQVTESILGPLRAVDAAYAEKAKALRPAKGEYESSAEYAARMKAADEQDALAVAERDAEKKRLEAKLQREGGERLKASWGAVEEAAAEEIVESAPAVLGAYDADAQEFPVSAEIDGVRREARASVPRKDAPAAKARAMTVTAVYRHKLVDGKPQREDLRLTVNDPVLGQVFSWSSGAGVAKRSSQAPSAPAKLELKASFADGDGDGRLASGETAKLTATVTNMGAGSAYGAALALAPGTTPGLAYASRHFLGEIPPGQSREAQVSIKALASASDGSQALTVSAADANGFSAEPIRVVFETRARRGPVLAVAGLEVKDAGGDGTATPGELVTVDLTVRNEGQGPAEAASFTVKPDGPDVFLQGDSWRPLGTLAPGQSASVKFVAFSNTGYTGEKLRFTASFSAGGESWSAPVEVPLRRALASARELVVKGKDVPPAPPAAGPMRPAFTAAPRPDDLAVIVGVESYAGIATQAPYAERDAGAFKEYVRALGVPERNIVLLTGARAGRSALAKNIEAWLPRMAKPESRVYFYFSGHGAPDVKTGQAYLVPWDGDPDFLETTAYPLAQLYQRLSALPVKQVLVALDSCFSGAGGRSVLASGARPLVSKVETGSVPAKLTVLAAAESNEISGSLDDRRHGAFTYFLLEGLNAGKSTPKQLNDYLVPRVQDEARRLNRDQTPQLQGDGSWSLR